MKDKKRFNHIGKRAKGLVKAAVVYVMVLFFVADIASGTDNVSTYDLGIALVNGNILSFEARDKFRIRFLITAGLNRLLEQRGDPLDESDFFELKDTALRHMEEARALFNNDTVFHAQIFNAQALSNDEFYMKVIANGFYAGTDPGKTERHRRKYFVVGKRRLRKDPVLAVYTEEEFRRLIKRLKLPVDPKTFEPIPEKSAPGIPAVSYHEEFSLDQKKYRESKYAHKKTDKISDTLGNMLTKLINDNEERKGAREKLVKRYGRGIEDIPIILEDIFDLSLDQNFLDLGKVTYKIDLGETEEGYRLTIVNDKADIESLRHKQYGHRVDKCAVAMKFIAERQRWDLTARDLLPIELEEHGMKRGLIVQVDILSGKSLEDKLRAAYTGDRTRFKAIMAAIREKGGKARNDILDELLDEIDENILLNERRRDEFRGTLSSRERQRQAAIWETAKKDLLEDFDDLLREDRGLKASLNANKAVLMTESEYFGKIKELVGSANALGYDGTTAFTIPFGAHAEYLYINSEKLIGRTEDEIYNELYHEFAHKISGRAVAMGDLRWWSEGLTQHLTRHAVKARGREYQAADWSYEFIADVIDILVGFGVDISLWRRANVFSEKEPLAAALRALAEKYFTEDERDRDLLNTLSSHLSQRDYEKIYDKISALRVAIVAGGENNSGVAGSNYIKDDAVRVGESVPAIPADEQYVLIVNSNLYKRNDYQKDMAGGMLSDGRYVPSVADKFKVEKANTSDIGNIERTLKDLLASGEITDLNKVVIQISDGLNSPGEMARLSALASKGVRFVRMDIEGLAVIKKTEERQLFRYDLYALLIAARKITEEDFVEQNSTFRVLKYLLNARYGEGDEDISAHYVNALLNKELGYIVNCSLASVPADILKKPEYHLVTLALIAA